MERKIGEVFTFKGETLRVVEQYGCEGCHFSHQACGRFMKTIGQCSLARSDNRSVIFKRVNESLEFLIKAHTELVRCGIESEIVDEIEEYLKLQ